MKLVEGFISARAVGTPGIVVRTADAASTIANVKAALVKGMTKNAAEMQLAKLPLVQWDAIHGLTGVNDAGSAAVVSLCGAAKIEQAGTANLPIALTVLEDAGQMDLIVFVHNVHLWWNVDPLVIQGVWNTRDKFKANGNMLLLMVALGEKTPAELNNDLLLLEEPLPTRADIKQIVKTTYAYAKHKLPSEEVLDQAADALVGIAFFPAEQAVAMELDMETGKLNIKGLWDRKKAIIGSVAGLSFYDGTETLADVGGCDNIKTYCTDIMNGKRGANVLLRIDEIEKAFQGSQTDSSGVKGDMLGNFLSWVEDKRIICMLFLGVPGASKSWFIYCLGGHFGKPVLNFDIAGMQDSLVGNSGKNLRTAEATVEAISDGQIILMATANSLKGLPAELISRFEKGGIFFFDSPSAEERAEILKLKIARYKLLPKQCGELPDMEGWTGREIDSMCDKADMLSDEKKGKLVTLLQAGQYVVPLTKSHSEDMMALRESASDRYLSASKPGLYKFARPVKVHTPTVTVPGRKMREPEHTPDPKSN